MKRYKTIDLAIIALVAAVLCILAPVSIPLGFTPIPITFGIFMVVLTGIILGSVRGVICILVYILLGAVGLPVFSGYIGGIQKIIGPTGGYLWGYLILVWMTGFFVKKFYGKWYMVLIGALLGMISCYAFGTIWIMLQLQLSLLEALWAGVIPFLPFDLLKIVIAVLICCPIRKQLIQQNLLQV